MKLLTHSLLIAVIGFAGTSIAAGGADEEDKKTKKPVFGPANQVDPNGIHD